MKFNVSSKILCNFASSVAKVINDKNALTILNNFYMELKDGILTLRGSNTENSLTAHIPVNEAQGEGAVCIDASSLVNMLKQIPDQGITVEVANSLNTTIEYSSGRFEFVALDGAGYPRLDTDATAAEGIQFLCTGNELRKGVDYTLFATSNDDYRQQMMGIYFDAKPNSLTFVATDTRKLVKYTTTECSPGAAASFIMPPKAAAIVRGLFADDENVKVKVTEKYAVFESESYIFQIQFIQGQYPDISRVIPRNNTLQLTIDRQTMLNAVRRVSVFVDPAHGLLKFHITPDYIDMKTEDTTAMNCARDRVPCSFTGDTMTIGFSATFLVEILSTITTDDVVISLSDPGRPGIFCPSENPEGTDLVMLLMPMTISNF